MQEIWKPIPGLDGIYEASSAGRIRSLDRTVKYRDESARAIKGTILVNQWTGRRYASVSIAIEGKVKTVPVHRLVAISFLQNELGLPEVNHIDGDRGNNASSNLEWVTRKQNNDHAISTGLKPPLLGSKHGMSVLNEEKVLQIRWMLDSGLPGKNIARLYGVDPGTISLIKTRKTWAHV